MGLFRLAFCCSICLAVVGQSPAFADETATARAAKTAKESAADLDGNADALGDSRNDTPEEIRTAVFQAVDEITEILTGMGDSENVAQLRAFREYVTDDDERRSATVVAGMSFELARNLRQRNELLAAKRLMPWALRFADIANEEIAKFSFAAHYEAALLETECENHAAALNHVSIALQCTELDDRPDWLIGCRAHYAFVLRKMKRFDEAEQIYLELIEQTKREPEGLSKDEFSNLRFALAALYADKGDYRQYYDALIDCGREPIEEGNVDPNLAMLRNTVFVNHSISIGDDLTRAEETAQKLVDWTQESYGVSSRRHVEAVELLAKVRVAQSRFRDAIALLMKSADLRARLFGPTHHSIARIYKEIDGLRKQQLENGEPIWTPPAQEPVSESDDRYNPDQLTKKP